MNNAREMWIANRRIADDEPCYIVAEVGNNHGGSLERCKEMIEAAYESGADAVKLQKRDIQNLYTKDFLSASYTGAHSFGATYGEHRLSVELSPEQYCDAIEYGQKVGITIFGTPFDFASADLMQSARSPAYKIASGDVKNLPLVGHVASFGAPMIISTGGCSISDVEAALREAHKSTSEVAVLQCTASYPANAENVNLSVIDLYRDRFPFTPVGYSSHDLASAISLFAIAHGARIIEKHFTLDKNEKGTDHSLSITPGELAELVSAARLYATAIGEPIKVLQECEKAAVFKMGKKLVAASALGRGTTLSREHIEIRSPGGGISPDHLPDIIGRKLAKPIEEGCDLKWSDLGVLLDCD